jgi:hypothetical protein
MKLEFPDPLTWLERLSLDAVAVALVWALALGGAAHIIGVEVLGLATWLTYVADRLWEARPGREVPQTDRHLYYQRHYRIWRIVWIMGFVFAVGLAVIGLPLWKWAGGWLIVLGVAVYLYFLGLNLGAGERLILKRTVVPVIFVAGVAWMAESWRTPETCLGTAVLLSGALVNVILVSTWERGVGNLPGALRRLYIAGLSGLGILGLAGLFIAFPVGLASLTAVAGFLLLHGFIRRESAGNLRVVADLVLVLAGLVLLVAQS